MKRSIIVLFAVLLSLPLPLFAQLYQWRGPNRDGQFQDTGLLKVWPEEGPEQFLEVTGIGKGYSSPVVTDKNILITGKKGDMDYLTCLDLEGNQIWQVPYGRSWEKSYPETRGSATVEDDRVYVISGTGQLGCFRLDNGEKIWEIDVDKDFEAEWHSWGVAESPLIVDNKVICSPGGHRTAVVAFNKLTGELIWESKSLGGQRSYVSPTIYEYNGHRYILDASATHLMALDPENGTIVWSFNYFEVDEWTYQPGLIWTNTPVFQGNRIFLSKGYNFPAVMLEMNEEGTAVTKVFQDSVLDNHHHGLILHDGFLYGSNWQSNGKGRWVCMRWEDGKIMWETDWNNKGSIIYADGLCYLFEERKGNVGLMDPSPDEMKVISYFKVDKGDGPFWAHPYIAHKNLYIRHGNVLLGYHISAD